jgi:hypothetical protein
MKKFKLFALSALTFSAGVMAASPPTTGGALQQLAPSPTLSAPAPKVDIQRWQIQSAEQNAEEKRKPHQRHKQDKSP